MAESTHAVTVLPRQNLSQSHINVLRSPGLLGRWPLIGLAMILLGGSLFGVLAIDLQTHGSLTQNDPQIVNSLHQVALQSSPLILDLMISGFYLGEHAIVIIGALLVVYFLHKRFWPELAMVLIAWGGEAGMWIVLSQYFHRARPMFEVSAWRQMTSPGFPSGHCFSAVLCFGLLAYFVAPKMSSPFWKAAVIMAAVLIILFIAFSRIFVGDHYLTDVLAGLGIGIAWAGLVYTSIELISRRNQDKPG